MWCYCGRGGGESFGRPVSDGAPRRCGRCGGRVIRAAWTADLKWTVQMRAREMELARAARESERTGRSSCGRPDVRGASAAVNYVQILS